MYSTNAELDGSLQKFLGQQRVGHVIQMSHRDQMHSLIRTIVFREQSLDLMSGFGAPGSGGSSASNYLLQDKLLTGMTEYEKLISKMTNSEAPFGIRTFTRILLVGIVANIAFNLIGTVQNVWMISFVMFSVIVLFFGLLEVCEELEGLHMNLAPFFRELGYSEGILRTADAGAPAGSRTVSMIVPGNGG